MTCFCGKYSVVQLTFECCGIFKEVNGFGKSDITYIISSHD